MDLAFTHRWRRLVPDIGDNQKAPKPFFLEVAEGVTNARMLEFREARKRFGEGATPKKGDDGKLVHPTRESLVPLMKAVVEGLVRFGDEPLKINGQPIQTIDDYLLVVACSENFYLWFELEGTIDKLNSIAGGMELFWQRQSGSPSTTPDQTVAKGESQQGAR